VISFVLGGSPCENWAVATILLLDVMGTLVHDPFFVEVPAFFGMSLSELIAGKHPDMWKRFERGDCTEEMLLEQFFADGRRIDGEGLKATMHAAYRYLDGIEALLQDLHGRDVPTHALSNYPSWYEMIEDRLQLSRYLSWSFVSCKTGVRKPDPEAYLGAARVLGVDPEACLFVDDREGNCRAARAIGMDAVEFVDAPSLRRALEMRGVL
jgi:FMN hydrolase / 5-amino-6-(5-phospho-D-ribitylamino)uracil phosphatase